jgi:hypothetical protein
VALIVRLGRTGAARPPHRRARDLPERATRAQVDHNGNRSWSPPVQPRSWSPDVGKHGPDDLRSHGAYGDAQRADASPRPTGGPGGQPACPWPARRSNRARCPSASHNDGQVQPDVAAGPARPAPAQTLRLGLGQLPEPFADVAGRPDSGPPGRVAACRADALHEVTGADTADTDAGRRTSTPGHWTPRHPDIGHRTRGHRMRGHRTPDTGHLDADGGCGQGDQDTAGMRTAGPHDEPTACWMPNRVPVGAAHAARGHHNGSAVRRPASARETAYRPTRQLLGRSASGQAAPRRTALLRELGGD